MDGFLKKIAQPSEQGTFDHLTRMEKTSINTFRNACADYALTSANVGLPRHLIEHSRPQAAYVTYTSPVVKMFVELDKQRKAASNRRAETEPNGEPQVARAEEGTQMPSGLSRSSSTAVTEEHSDSMSTAESSSTNFRYRIVFAQKPPSSSLALSSKKK